MGLSMENLRHEGNVLYLQIDCKYEIKANLLYMHKPLIFLWKFIKSIFQCEIDVCLIIMLGKGFLNDLCKYYIRQAMSLLVMVFILLVILSASVRICSIK
jgi:hypothetical protein